MSFSIQCYETVITLFVDINECATNNGGCQQICNNFAGGRSCDCNSGYTLNNNGRTCRGEARLEIT